MNHLPRASSAAAPPLSFLGVALAALLSPFGSASFASPPTTQPPATPEAAAPLDEVLVTGEQPGPGTWRVSRDGHDLWILGTLEPLPKKMNWRTRDTDALIARSQEVLAPPHVELHFGFFKGLTAIPTALHARKNADGETLAQVLPPELYARWRTLKDTYLGRDNGVEKFRPLFAARELYVGALAHSGLSSEKIVWNLVRESARAHHVPVSAVDLDITVNDPKGTIRELEQIPRDPDVACLARTIERLETDLGAMRQRANLWALGDVAGLRDLTYPDERATCFDAVASVPALGDQMVKARDQLASLWITAAENALARNSSTFAVLPITELMDPNGPLSRLREQGYVIVEP